jgi:DNA-3-methyladenine glycosylase
VRDRDLARGPGRLGQALGLTLTDGGADLFGDGPARLELGAHPVGTVASGPRVGVSRAADVAWRFWIRDDPYVSSYQRSPRARGEDA